jgi:galactokinase
MKNQSSNTSSTFIAQSVTVRSPGRINLIGEHTDYNDGFVMPAAIDKQIVIRIERNGSPDACTLRAKNLDKSFTFSLAAVKPQPSGWENYVLGVIHEFQELGAKMAGFDAEIEGNVPIGSGMSSSAALECSTGYGLNELFDLGFDKDTIIKAAQRAEHGYVGTNCGIMDMFASVRGREGHVIRLDCRSLEYDYFPLELGDYELLLLNTNVSHSLASSAYNTRREECEEGVRILGKTNPGIRKLRDVDEQMLDVGWDQLPDNVARRCRHIVRENNRVLEAGKVLEAGDLARMGELMYASHHSLRHDYEVSCPELDFLVDQTKDHPGVLGARMMGGGFGGCTLNLVRSADRDTLIKKLAASYRDEFNLDLTPYQVKLADGTSIINRS